MIQFQVVLLGPTGCGKTCLLNYFLKKPNPNQVSPTIGLDIQSCEINIKGQDCLFQIVDTNGHVYKDIQEQNLLILNKKIIPRLVIIFYELWRNDGEQNIEYFINLVKSRYQDDIDIAIIGTMMEKGIHENQNNIEKRFQNYKIYKVSTNIQEIFIQLFTKLYDKYESQLPNYYLLQVEETKRRKWEKEQKKNEKKKKQGTQWFCCGSSD